MPKHIPHSRKSDARRFLALLDALQTLRKARDPSEAPAFDAAIEKLRALWKNALATYIAEDDAKRDTTTENDVSSRDNNPHAAAAIEDWKRAMFGSTDVESLKRFEDDPAAFIVRRRDWDRYACDTGGFPVPLGWLCPPSPDERWKIHLGV